MKQLGKDEVELTDDEMLIHELHDRLLDLGHDQGAAADIITGANIPPYLMSPTPRLDATLTPEFVAWLRR